MELKEHIDDIRNRLEQKLFPNETAVRQGIVDRLLNALGWETFDTQRVFPEYPINGGRVDYALCHPPGKPIVFIEVKRVGNIEGAERQLFEYAFHEGVPILILTDGQKWRFFHPAGSGSYQERLVRELDLITDGSEESSECLLKYLTYAAVQAGIAGQVIAENYQEISQHREVRRHLPEAWDNLLSGTSGDSEFLIEAVQSETDRLCGNRPTYEQVLAFLDEFRKGTEIDPDPPTTVQKTHEHLKARPQEKVNDITPQLPDPRLGSTSSKREKYRSYFQQLIDELREQHNFTKVRAGKPQNDHFFSSGFRGIWYHVNFGRNRRVYTSLYIDFENHEENKNFFDVLKARESEINAKFGNVLSWERRNEHRLSTVRLMREGDIDADASELEAIRAWHIENLLKFKEVFTPEIELAFEKLSLYGEGENMKRDMTVTSRDTSENMFGGDKLYQQRARAALPILVQCAKAHKTITYKELGAAVGMTDLRSIGRVCGSVAATLADLQERWQGGDIPRITNLAIRSDDRPGAWVCEQLTGDREKAPPQEEYDALLEVIYGYQRWDTVLGELGLIDDL